jgi:hypothetical protein
METLIGFAVGFVVGTQYGRDGLAKLKESWGAISASPEVHNLLRTGAAVAGSAVREVMNGGVGEVVASIVRKVDRAAE